MARPGGAIPHIVMVALARQANVGMIHVPFRGSAEAIIALLRGDVTRPPRWSACDQSASARCNASPRDRGLPTHRVSRPAVTRKTPRHVQAAGIRPGD